LLDADAPDRELTLAELSMVTVTSRQLVWADLVAPDEDTLAAAAAAFGLPAATAAWLAADDQTAEGTVHGGFVRLRTATLEPSITAPLSTSLGIVSGSRYVLTVHHGAIQQLDHLDAAFAADAAIGQVNSAVFLAAVLNVIVTGYLQVIDAFEDRVDDLDVDLLTLPTKEVLARLVELRRIVSDVRRVITAQRDVFGALAWADTEHIAETNAAGRFELVNERFDRAVDAVENARGHLATAFDIEATRTGQRTNDVMKVLTIVSAVLLPGTLLVSLLSMNVASPLPPNDVRFWWLVVGMVLTNALVILILARRARWL
jgi:Mg2+ and Co2+ transporter CorA